MRRLRGLILMLMVVGLSGAGCGDGDAPELQYRVPGCGDSFINDKLLVLFSKCALAGGSIFAVNGMCTCECPGWDQKIIDERNYDTAVCPPFGETEIADSIVQGFEMIDVVEEHMYAAEELAVPPEGAPETLADAGDSSQHDGEQDPSGPEAAERGGADKKDGGATRKNSFAAQARDRSGAGAADNPRSSRGKASQTDVVYDDGGGAAGRQRMAFDPGKLNLSANALPKAVALSEAKTAAAALEEERNVVVPAAKSGSETEQGFEVGSTGGRGGRSGSSEVAVDPGARGPAADREPDVSPNGVASIFDLVHPHYQAWQNSFKK